MQTKTRSILTESFAALLLLLFLYTAVSKLMDHHQFLIVLKKSPLLKPFAWVISWLVPLSEIGISALLFVPSLRVYGFRLSFLLMSVFTVYIGYMIFFTPHLPCSCGGVIRKMSWGQHLFFNLFFIGIAGWGARMEKQKLVVAITQA